jgi:hypothetical protein
MKFTNSNRVKINIWHYSYYYLYDQAYRRVLEHVNGQDYWQVYDHVNKHVFHQFAPIVNKIEQEFKK